MTVLTERSVTRTLFSMAFPMLAGTFAMNAYQLADAYFVSRLGTFPLAAMGFIYPVVMLLTFIAGGLGVGVTTLTSHAIGRHDHRDAARLVTHGVALTVMTSVVLSIAGYLGTDWIFARLGADADTMPLIRQFMHIWFLGALTMSLPMMGNGILISSGDSRSASMFMVLGALLNVALNPILIFGAIGLPAMGIAGSALATVLSQAVATAWLLYLLGRKHRLLAFAGWRLGDYLVSFRRIVGFAIPSVLSMMLMPISAALITRILAGCGPEAVAATGAAQRIEMFAFVIPMALGMSLTPFVSQNFGAARTDRVREARKTATLFALGYGALVAAVFVAGAPLLASFFTQDPKVAATLISYIRIISLGYGMMEVHRYCGFFLTGLHRPASATALNAVRVVGLLIPLSYLGAYLWGTAGVFAGRLATDILVGCIGMVWVAESMKYLPATAPAAAPSAGPERTDPGAP
jgi:putative MATE family efflux protein